MNTILIVIQMCGFNEIILKIWSLKKRKTILKKKKKNRALNKTFGCMEIYNVEGTKLQTPKPIHTLNIAVRCTHIHIAHIHTDLYSNKMCHSSRKRTEAGSSIQRATTKSCCMTETKRFLIHCRVQKNRYICVNAINFGHLFEFHSPNDLFLF